jgi:hypothetical protein
MGLTDIANSVVRRPSRHGLLKFFALCVACVVAFSVSSYVLWERTETTSVIGTYQTSGVSRLLAPVSASVVYNTSSHHANGGQFQNIIQISTSEVLDLPATVESRMVSLQSDCGLGNG